MTIFRRTSSVTLVCGQWSGDTHGQGFHVFLDQIAFLLWQNEIETNTTWELKKLINYSQLSVTDIFISRQLYMYVYLLTMFSIPLFAIFPFFSSGNNSRKWTALLMDTFPIPKGSHLRESCVMRVKHIPLSLCFAVILRLTFCKMFCLFLQLSLIQKIPAVVKHIVCLSGVIRVNPPSKSQLTVFLVGKLFFLFYRVVLPSILLSVWKMVSKMSRPNNAEISILATSMHLV